MDNEAVSAGIDRIEGMLRARWNVAALAGRLADVIGVLRDSLDEGDTEAALGALAAELAGRELYRWAAPVASTITEIRDALTERTETARPRGRRAPPVSEQNERTE